MQYSPCGYTVGAGSSGFLKMGRLLGTLGIHWGCHGVNGGFITGQKKGRNSHISFRIVTTRQIIVFAAGKTLPHL